MAPKLTKEQAAIIGAYTGYLVGPFADVQEYAERVIGRPVWTHEFGTDAFAEGLKAAARDDFLAICFEREAA
jgi:hypothetical protein